MNDITGDTMEILNAAEQERMKKLMESGRGEQTGWKPCPKCGRHVYYVTKVDLSAFTKKERKTLLQGIMNYINFINDAIKEGWKQEDMHS